ncbi:substrate-binding periplasmic protein [Roseospira visakhapatnamensis]|uniref:ABC-type amino acid transport substrate-binding protein n=1 Tax=Roseospira visakhapatnamensis TaxID=390880 RepID=A0A7W6W937_9PROT|nr:transporter substrate-binding domain-containing protein [Roseospira visakhapatnamensis]MBB4265489.1 ABC-type amino acid transport substrate-binding protein [Roseospira visakhapatnamensis]
MHTLSARGIGATLAMALVLSIAGSDRGHAQESARAYVVGVENLDYLPAYGIEDGAYVGYARQFLDAFAADQGLRFDYRPMPVRRLYASLAAGTIDFKFPDNPNWNTAFVADNAVVYSGPVADFLDASVVRADRIDIAPDAVKTLGTVTGFGPWPWTDRIEAGTVTLSENADFAALVRQVLAGRVDAAYASIAVVNRVLDQDLNQPGALVFAPGLPHDYGSYLMSTIAHPDVITQLDAWVETNANRITALKDEHGVEHGVDPPE